LVRDHEVPVRLRGSLQNVEGRHAGGGNTRDRRGGVPGLERVDGLRAPGDLLTRKLLLDAGDDFLRGHDAALQNGSLTASASTRSPGAKVRIQAAQARMPGSSETMRPIEMSALAAPASRASSMYGTTSHSRGSPASTTSALFSRATVVARSVVPGLTRTVRTRMPGAPTVRMPPRSPSRSLTWAISDDNEVSGIR